MDRLRGMSSAALARERQRGHLRRVPEDHALVPPGQQLNNGDRGALRGQPLRPRDAEGMATPQSVASLVILRGRVWETQLRIP
eukprot:202482-Pyramimonas_sp.AAC.1